MKTDELSKKLELMRSAYNATGNVADELWNELKPLLAEIIRLQAIVDSITPQRLHELYLESTKLIHPESYNPDAQKSYEALSDDQKQISVYIAEGLLKG